MWNVHEIEEEVAVLCERSCLETVVEALANYCHRLAKHSDDVGYRCYTGVAEALLAALDKLDT